MNQLVIKDAYPIPNINTMLNQLTKAKVFSTIDLTHGYYQIPMQERSKKYTAFACEFGFFEFNVLPMGITNACETFQRLINNVLGELIGVICFVYLDDIIVFSDTYEEHLLHIQMITDKLRAAYLKIKLKKCDFVKERIEYLSHVIENGKISPSPKKVEAIANFQRPTTETSAELYWSHIVLPKIHPKLCKNSRSVSSRHNK